MHSQQQEAMSKLREWYKEASWMSDVDFISYVKAQVAALNKADDLTPRERERIALVKMAVTASHSNGYSGRV